MEQDDKVICTISKDCNISNQVFRKFYSPPPRGRGRVKFTEQSRPNNLKGKSKKIDKTKKL